LRANYPNISPAIKDFSAATSKHPEGFSSKLNNVRDSCEISLGASIDSLKSEIKSAVSMPISKNIEHWSRAYKLYAISLKGNQIV
jgi:hypothetical protein|tara:strand:- start:515 stop:769 length:255 start_codon:yes stop_codon:yes gene_type:complete